MLPSGMIGNGFSMSLHTSIHMWYVCIVVCIYACTHVCIYLCIIHAFTYANIPRITHTHTYANIFWSGTFTFLARQHAVVSMEKEARLHNDCEGGDPGCAWGHSLGPGVLVVACSSGKANFAHDEVAVSGYDGSHGSKRDLQLDDFWISAQTKKRKAECASARMDFAQGAVIYNVGARSVHDFGAAKRQSRRGVHLYHVCTCKYLYIYLLFFYRCRKVCAVVCESSNSAGQGKNTRPNNCLEQAENQGAGACASAEPQSGAFLAGLQAVVPGQQRR
jgi:hypothetical protein